MRLPTPAIIEYRKLRWEKNLQIDGVGAHTTQGCENSTEGGPTTSLHLRFYQDSMQHYLSGRFLPMS